MTATARPSPSLPLTLPGRKTASGGLATVPRLRAGRWRPQPTDAPGKMHPGYDRARRCSHLPQSPIPCDAAGCTNPDPSTWDVTPPPLAPNGCGASAGDAVPEYFPGACAAHDICYGTAGNAKAQCDTNFKNYMLDTCRSRGSGPVCVSTAFIYWRAVVIFGGGPYRDAQREAQLRLRYGR